MDIVFSQIGVAGHILLSREKALNALTGDMTLKMKAQLESWANDKSVEAIIIEGEGERAFCAGGDIRAIYETGKNDVDKAIDFFRAEYNLNALIHYYPKPFISLIDGIAMGGGVGVSSHGSHCVVTERCTLSMPENIIGFIPDVGTTYILSRAPGHMGEYLAMTGGRMSAADAIYTGFAKYYVPSSKLEDLKDKIANGADVDSTLKEFSGDTETGKIEAKQQTINDIFSKKSPQIIYQYLGDLADQEDKWAGKMHSSLQKMSPTSIACSLRSVQLARQSNTIEDCLTNEFRFAFRALNGREFYEGIRALIIDKDNKPNWQPETLEGVSEEFANSFFAELGEAEWQYENY